MFHPIFKKSVITVSAVILVLSLSNARLVAHGFEGDRFFPPTILTDDPFATDEFSFPTISVQKLPSYNDAPKLTEIDVSSEFVKEIFPKFALGIEGTYINQSGHNVPTTDGFDNLSLSAKYQVWESPRHEWILSLGGEVDLGNTGSPKLDVEPYSTFTPTLYFGKGFGDLPASLKYFRPLALTGTFGYGIPARGGDPNTFEYGWAWEYSLPYLQDHVEDIKLPKPLGNMIPLVEFSFETPANRGGGWTTGTIDPGVLWEFPDCQIGAEAVIPADGHTSPHVGGVFQVQIYIDDLFPKVFGHPIFGAKGDQ